MIYIFLYFIIAVLLCWLICSTLEKKGHDEPASIILVAAIFWPVTLLELTAFIIESRIKKHKKE